MQRDFARHRPCEYRQFFPHHEHEFDKPKLWIAEFGSPAPARTHAAPD
jgi:hypothetical protein